MFEPLNMIYNKTNFQMYNKTKLLAISRTCITATRHEYIKYSPQLNCWKWIWFWFSISRLKQFVARFVKQLTEPEWPKLISIFVFLFLFCYNIVRIENLWTTLRYIKSIYLKKQSILIFRAFLFIHDYVTLLMLCAGITIETNI